MRRVSLLCLCLFFSCYSLVAAEEVVVNGITLTNTHADINMTIDVIEFRQGNAPVAHLTTGRKHYGFSLISFVPVPMFEAELPLSSATTSQFSVSVEDGREFSRCLVTGLVSSGSGTDRRLIYTLRCEDVSLPPATCGN